MLVLRKRQVLWRRAFIASLLTMSLALVACIGSAQATTATASRAADLQLGGGYSLASPDYGPRINGFSLYGTYDFRPHLGVEFNFHQINSRSGNSIYERTYEIGPRYVVHLNNGLNPYVRLMYGRGVFNFPANVANLAYNIGAIGGGVDYDIHPHLRLRGDYDYQRWFSFPPHGLTPNVVTLGVAYHF